MPSLPLSGEISFRTFNIARGLQAVYTLDMAHAAYVYGVDAAGGISMDEFYSKDDIFFEYTLCGQSNTNSGGASTDATLNPKTYYSNKSAPNFGVGSYIYTDRYPTSLYGSTHVYINGGVWEVNTYGVVTAFSDFQP
jgi:hypothetical protein